MRKDYSSVNKMNNTNRLSVIGSSCDRVSLQNNIKKYEERRKIKNMEKMFNFIRIMESEAFDRMMSAYIKYLHSAMGTQGVKSLHVLKDEEIAAIPKEMLVALMCDEIDRIRNRLPVRVQEDTEIQGYMRCLEHYNGKGTQVDGPPLIRNKCPDCMRQQVSSVCFCE